MEHPSESAFRRHYAQIFRYIRRQAGSDEAEDLTQAVFADAAARLRHFQPGPTPVLAWLYTVAQRRLADRARRLSSSPQTVAPLEVVRARGIEDTSYGASVANALRQAIAQLPEGQRRVVVMKLLEGRAFADIAREVGATEAACKMRFARGLEALRADLATRGLDP